MKWKFNGKTGTLTFYGNGVACYYKDYMKNFNPDDVKKIVLKGNHNHIRKLQYFKNVEKVYLNSSVKVIGTNCFNGCKKLKKVSGMDSVVSICNRAFYKCNNLKKINIGKNMSTLCNSKMFAYSGITSLVIPETMEAVELTRMNKLNKVTVYSEKVIKSRHDLVGSLLKSSADEITLIVPDGQYKLYKSRVNNAIKEAKEKAADFDMNIVVKKMSDK